MPIIPDAAAFQQSFAALPVLRYRPGETVLAAGSTTQRLLVLRQGAVEVVRDGTHIAKIAEPGAVFGELSALLDKPHTADVRALEQSEFSIADASALLASNSAAPLYIAAILARRLDAANTALIELKRQLAAGKPPGELAKTVNKVEELLSSGGSSLVYAGYPYDPFAHLPH